MPNSEADRDCADDQYLRGIGGKGGGDLLADSEGSLVALISGGIDSPVAAWMMMRQGCRILPLFIDMPPFLGESALRRTRAVTEVLGRYQPALSLHVVEDTYVARAREAMRGSDGERYLCLLCKRRMYRIAEAYARSVDAKGIVTGESTGQVASQTLKNLAALRIPGMLPVHRPLIGFDKEEIIEIAREIGTYGPSIMPVSNCCCAVPKRPATSADPDQVRRLEERLAGTLGEGQPSWL